MFSLSVSGLLKSAGVHPLLQALAIILGTFVLEDAATVLAALQVQDGKIAWEIALGALYVGIVLGDLGLYGLGRGAASLPWIRRLLPQDRQIASRQWVEQRVFHVVFVSRFIPGARLPTYTSCGYLKANFALFAAAAIVATLVWTTLLFLVSRHVGQYLIDHFGAWRWLGGVVFAAAIVLIGRLVMRLQKEVG